VPVFWALESRAQDFELLLSAGQLALLGQRCGQRSTCATCADLNLLVDRSGIPLAVCLAAANTHDSMLMEQVVDAVPPVKGGRPGRPRKRPAELHLDKGYDYPRCRKALRRRGIIPRIARRGIQPRDKLGRHR
jgi:hypothetical protein